MLRCPASVFRMCIAVPLLARFVKKVLRPLWLLAPSSPAPTYSSANVCAKLFALNPALSSLLSKLEMNYCLLSYKSNCSSNSLFISSTQGTKTSTKVGEDMDVGCVASDDGQLDLSAVLLKQR